MGGTLRATAIQLTYTSVGWGGHGQLSGKCQHYRRVALYGNGRLAAATATAVFRRSPDLKGNGRLSATARARFPITGAAFGRGQLRATTRAKFDVKVHLAARGRLTATAVAIQFHVFPQLSCRGRMRAFTGYDRPADLPAHGQLSGDDARMYQIQVPGDPAALVLTGQGLLSATAQAWFAADGNLSGHGQLRATSRMHLIGWPVPLWGNGQLMGTVTMVRVFLEPGLTGHGQLSTGPMRIRIGTIYLPAHGELTGQAFPVFPAEGDLDGHGELTGEGFQRSFKPGNLDAHGELTATAALPADAQLHANGDLSGTVVYVRTWRHRATSFLPFFYTGGPAFPLMRLRRAQLSGHGQLSAVAVGWIPKPPVPVPPPGEGTFPAFPIWSYSSP